MHVYHISFKMEVGKMLIINSGQNMAQEHMQRLRKFKVIASDQFVNISAKNLIVAS